METILQEIFDPHPIWILFLVILKNQQKLPAFDFSFVSLTAHTLEGACVSVTQFY